MQSLKNLFSRTPSPKSAEPVQQPTELTAESLKQVSGGLPRVSEVAGQSVETDPTELPRVS